MHTVVMYTVVMYTVAMYTVVMYTVVMYTVVMYTVVMYNAGVNMRRFAHALTLLGVWATASTLQLDTSVTSSLLSHLRARPPAPTPEPSHTCAGVGASSLENTSIAKSGVSAMPGAASTPASQKLGLEKSVTPASAMLAAPWIGCGARWHKQGEGAAGVSIWGGGWGRRLGVSVRGGSLGVAVRGGGWV
eukprot:363432-Chlamydomonas_euryale.AAC.5